MGPLDSSSHNDAPVDEAGYVLIEVLVATLIAASIFFLLISTLREMGRAQDQAAILTAKASAQLFDDTLLRHVFGKARPDYADEDRPFRGTSKNLSGYTWFENGEYISPIGFELSLIESDERSDLVLMLGDEQRTIMTFDTVDIEFSYIGFDGNTTSVWTGEETPDPEMFAARFAKYSTSVPLQVRITQSGSTPYHLIRSYSLPSHDWPMPRIGKEEALAPL